MISPYSNKPKRGFSLCGEWGVKLQWGGSYCWHENWVAGAGRVTPGVIWIIAWRAVSRSCWRPPQALMGSALSLSCLIPAHSSGLHLHISQLSPVTTLLSLFGNRTLRFYHIWLFWKIHLLKQGVVKYPSPGLLRYQRMTPKIPLKGDAMPFFAPVTFLLVGIW